jgi:hypothetical protein
MPKRKNITGSNSTTSGIALQTILPKIFNVFKMHILLTFGHLKFRDGYLSMHRKFAFCRLVMSTLHKYYLQGMDLIISIC